MLVDLIHHNVRDFSEIFEISFFVRVRILYSVNSHEGMEVRLQALALKGMCHMTSQRCLVMQSIVAFRNGFFPPVPTERHELSDSRLH
jgi:hypothetical protein